jgi:hypothetical protein
MPYPSYASVSEPDEALYAYFMRGAQSLRENKTAFPGL